MNDAPFPSDSDESARWRHTREVRRMLYGKWEADLQRASHVGFGPIRKEAIGDVDISRNFIRSVSEALAVTYVRPPSVGRKDGAGDGGDLAERIADGKYWALMAGTGQRDLIGLRELYVRIDIPDADEPPSYRTVPPDLVIAKPSSDRPDVPEFYAELRARLVPGASEAEWTWDVFDLRRAGRPVYVVCLDNGGEFGADVTAKVYGREFVGESYPWRWTQGRRAGRPYMPVVLYHARQTGKLHDAWANSESKCGTYQIGQRYTFLAHIHRKAAWPQRWTLNAAPGSAAFIDDNGDGHGRQEIPADPSMVLQLYTVTPESADAGVTAQVGQWQNAADPMLHIEAISVYERTLATGAGIPAADLQRISGDPRSGYAIALSREGQKEVQAALEPQMRFGDLELIEKTAAGYNAMGGSYPEDGWTITYHSHPPTAMERKAEIEVLQAKVASGLLSRVGMIREMHPELSREEAIARVVEAMLEEQEVERLAGAVVAPPPMIEEVTE